MNPVSFRLVALSALAVLPLVRADVSLAPLFTDHAVLQRGKPIPLWGVAADGEEIIVAFRDVHASTRAGADGSWRIELPAQLPGDAAELTVTGANRIVLRDVVVGDVWLCSGQSNMAFPVEKARDAATEIAVATYPKIRHFQVAFAPGDTPAATVGGAWQTCSPETVGKFTAVGYFFARDVQPAVEVPIGIINSSVGGTPVEAWMPSEALASLPGSAELARAIATSAKKAGLRAKSQPGVLYNGMIAPLVPYALRGFLWYQGEANANARNPQSAANYARNFQALISSWRQSFGPGQGELPFYFVQLPNFSATGAGPDSWPAVREAQGQALHLPATGMVVTIDVGSPDNIHPKNKQVIGHRLALLALKHAYRQPVEAAGPALVEPRRRGDRLVLSFDQPLVLKPAPDGDRVFEIAGDDGKFLPAQALVENHVLSLHHEAVERPVSARYAWSNNPRASLFNASGLPAAPFRVKLDGAPE